MSGVHFGSSLKSRIALIYCDFLSIVRCQSQRGLSTHVVAIGSKSMEDSRRQNDQVVLFQPNSYPSILRVPDIKKSIPIKDVSDLFIFVQVLVEEHLHFLFVHGAHFVGRDSNFISVLVRALGGNFVDVGDGRAVVIKDAEFREVVGVDCTAGVMVETLIALIVGLGWCMSGGGKADRTYFGVVIVVGFHDWLTAFRKG